MACLKVKEKHEVKEEDKFEGRTYLIVYEKKETKRHFTLGVHNDNDIVVPFQNFADSDLQFDFPDFALEFYFDHDLGWMMKKADNDEVDDIEYWWDIRSTNMHKKEDMPFA